MGFGKQRAFFAVERALRLPNQVRTQRKRQPERSPHKCCRSIGFAVGRALLLPDQVRTQRKRQPERYRSGRPTSAVAPSDFAVGRRRSACRTQVRPQSKNGNRSGRPTSAVAPLDLLWGRALRLPDQVRTYRKTATGGGRPTNAVAPSDPLWGGRFACRNRFGPQKRKPKATGAIASTGCHHSTPVPEGGPCSRQSVPPGCRGRPID